MRKIRTVITVTSCLWALIVHGQVFEVSDISFTEDGQALDLPFAGGLRAPQFNNMDIDLDGRDDLIVFDREGEIILPLLRQQDGSFRLDISYREIFPQINSWMRLVDYNGDGLEDLFCAPIANRLPGVEVHRAVIREGRLAYDQVLFPQNPVDIIFYPIGAAQAQAYVSPADQPHIEDLDGDGDVDILAFEPGGSSVFYYENLTADTNADPDLFEMRIADQCYGAFVESGVSQEVSLSPTPGDCASFFRDQIPLVSKPRHAGSTVTAEDVNGDGLLDLFLGDIAYDGVVALFNGGNSDQAWFTEQDIRFPQSADEPADIELFLSTYFIDVDLNGIDELIVTPNDRFGAQGKDHIWLYERVQTPGSADQFVLETKNFLVDQMVFTGQFSAPLFLDENQDGLVDLLIGSSGQSIDGVTFDPRLVLYRNNGTATSPSFELADMDYLNMSQFSTTSNQFSPAIGDLDGDGDMDMVIGDDIGRLYYAENISGNESIDLRSPRYDLWGIKVGAWAKPAIYDHNGDGLADLIIGEQNFNSQNGERGSLNYFQNIGTVGEPNFEPDESISPNDPVWGGVFTKESVFVNNYSSPALISVGDRELLVTGTEKGTFYLYDSLSADLDSFILVTTELGRVRDGNNSTMSLADIDDDDLLEAVVGSRRGGIVLYETDIIVDFSSSTEQLQASLSAVSIEPNPTAGATNITIQDMSCEPCSYQVFDHRGAVVRDEVFRGPLLRLDLSTAFDGLYLLRISNGKQFTSTKVIKTTR
ncbi:MAG: FG-GAP-like repeat-containing protein [Bacteroidota bacterium]